jgi:ribosomal protein L11 methyltransferase
LGDAHVLSHVSGVFDVVLANINRNILLADMPRFKEVMTHGSILIISGFYEEDSMVLAEKAGKLGMSLICPNSENNWCMLQFRIE